MKEKVLAIARAILEQRYPECTVAFAAGSIIRGEGTAYSDLDLVVVYDSLPNAFRESFLFDGLPVEAFIHDPFTMNYFFTERDRVCGMPALMFMVKEGVEIPGPNHVSESLKELAVSVLEAGPPPLTVEDDRLRRYGISDLLDDVRDARSETVIFAAGSLLFGSLGDYYLRANGYWSGGGKSVLGALRRANPELHVRYGQCFERLFKHADPSRVIALAEELLAPFGGLFFDGLHLDAPVDWTKPIPSAD